VVCYKATVSADLEPGSTFGLYRIESLLGRGGMSVVYLAEDTRLGRRVAIKVLASELAADDAFRTRFVRESQLAAGLEHPNIVPVYEAGEAEGQLFIAMRYVRGTDLRTLITHEGPLNPERTIALLRPVAAALDTAHRRGLVHRDVKPANILIANDEGEEHVYLSDFGLSKHTSSRSGLTKTGQFMGTVDYVAPEQIQGHTVDGRADGYSLACVLFECLTAKVPFAKDSDVATLFGHIQDPPPRVTQARETLPGEIDGVIAHGMAKNPDDRPQTSTSLIDAAARALGAPSGPKEAPPSVPAAPTILAPPPPGPWAGTTPPASGTGTAPPTSGPGTAPPVPSVAAGSGPAAPPPKGGGSNNARLIAIFGAAGVLIAAILVIVGLSLSKDDNGPTVQTPSPASPTTPPPIEAANTSVLTIPADGTANPYPAPIEVAGATGTITRMTVTLTGFSHAFPEDVDVLLVGPSGANAVLMADVGGGNSLNDVTLTFDDAAPDGLPDKRAIVSGTYRPSLGTDRGGGACCNFQGGAPAPSPPFGTELSVFEGSDPNGSWNLFVFDDSPGDAGQIAGGWSLVIETAAGGGGAPSPTGPTAAPSAAVTSNSQEIVIPDSGEGDPYPSSIEVSGLSGTIVDVKVTLSGFGHEFADDVDVLLVGPSGQSVVLMADMGGFDTVGNVVLTFDDAAPAPVPDETLIVSGSYRPTREKRCCQFDGDAPAPPAPHASQLSVFDGTDPNGAWNLFVFDDGVGDQGAVSGGWSLEISTAV
jgi:serine/threonine protein kinase/subtilisin-like proprotein convertase family protein